MADMSVNSSVQSAISFLRDPSVSSAPLTKKIAFLEAKGLNQADIETALHLAGSAGGSASVYSAAPSSQYRGAYGRSVGGLHNEWQPDWRDWFIVAVVSGSVGAGLYALAKKYLIPALAPPSQTEVQAAQDALAAKYDEAAAILRSLQEETEQIRSTLDEQVSKVDESVDKVIEVLEEVKEHDRDREEEFTKVRDEVDALRGLMERMFDKHKDAQTTALNDIQSEVRSLKSLLAKRQVQEAQPTASNGNGANGMSSGTPSLGNSAMLQSQPTPSPFTPTIPGNYSKSALYSSTPISSKTGGRFGLSSSSTMPDLPSVASASTSSTPSIPSFSVLSGVPSSTSSTTPAALPHSRSFDHIANRPPGIPAWQRQDTTSSPADSAAAVTFGSALMPPTPARDSEDKAAATIPPNMSESSSTGKSTSIEEEDE